MADPILANTCARLAARNVELLLIDPDAEGDDLEMMWSMDPGCPVNCLQIGNRTIGISDIEAVYLRGMGGRMPRTVNERMRLTCLWEFVDRLPALVVNPRQASHTNMSKPYQLRLIASYGFQIPETLITMEPNEVRAFYHEYNGRVIYKSISAERSIVKTLTTDDFSRLDRIRHCPIQLQEMIPGFDIRVHTVGDRVFATEICSGGTDYRYAERENLTRSMRAMELEASVEAQCLKMAKGLGLSLSGIDLRRTSDGAYYCFEVNTSPGFTFFENHTGQRIGDALADMLCAARA